MTDLDTIMSGRDDSAPAQETVTEQQPAQGQPRDDSGRFAPSEQAPPPAVEQQPEARPATPDGFVPIQALDARLAKQQERYEAQLREQEERIRREVMAQVQPRQPPEPPKPLDPFAEDFDGAINSRVQQQTAPIAQGQQAIVENFSRMIAEEKFGEETVSAAYSEMANRMRSNPQTTLFDYQRIMASRHPFGELVKWHKAQTALGTYGDDPTAYREKVRAELLAEMQAGQPGTPTSQAQPVMPSQFAGTRSAGPTSSQVISGPRPLSDIMGGR